MASYITVVIHAPVSFLILPFRLKIGKMEQVVVTQAKTVDIAARNQKMRFKKYEQN